MNRLCRSLIQNKSLIKTLVQKTNSNSYSNATRSLLFKSNQIAAVKFNFLNLASYSTTTSPTFRDFQRQAVKPSDDNKFENRDYVPVEDDLSYAPKSHHGEAENAHGYDSKSEFSNFNIPKVLLDRLKELGYNRPFPIQEATLPHTLAGKDCIGKAITGSGKTLAFSIPIICKILNSPKKESRYPKALVLAPTRELCMQLHKSIQELAPQLKCVSIYGGTQLENQVRQLSGRVDVVCATPGRLRDLLQRRNFVTDDIELVCLDEADELLTPNFMEQITDVLETANKKQMLLFSATINKTVASVVNKYMENPEMVDLTDGQKAKLPENVKHFILKAPFLSNADIIAHYLDELKSQRCIVFTRSKVVATILTEKLNGMNINSQDLHSGHSQEKRERVFKAFRRGAYRVLVATDVASRGIDIPEIDLVINVSVPPNGLDYYIHRSGRTGRGGRPGTSILLHSGESTEQSILSDIRRAVKLTELSIPEKLKARCDQLELRSSSRSFGGNSYGDRTSRFSRDDNRDSFDRPRRRFDNDGGFNRSPFGGNSFMRNNNSFGEDAAETDGLERRSFQSPSVGRGQFGRGFQRNDEATEDDVFGDNKYGSRGNDRGRFGGYNNNKASRNRFEDD